MFAYSDVCWRQMTDVLRDAPDAYDAPFETTSQWKTVRLLLAHCIAAEERWITLRLNGQPLPVGYEERAATTPEGLYEDFKTVRAATWAYLQNLPDGDLDAEVPIVLPQWAFSGKLTRADIFFHMVNHENYHRGQVVGALQRLGMDPPNFDYVLLKEQMGNDGADS